VVKGSKSMGSFGHEFLAKVFKPKEDLVNGLIEDVKGTVICGMYNLSDLPRIDNEVRINGLELIESEVPWCGM